MSTWDDFKTTLYMFVWGAIFTAPLMFVAVMIGNTTPVRDVIGSTLAFIAIFPALVSILGFVLMVILMLEVIIKYILNKVNRWL
jgi:hypothetical protein